MYRLTKLQFRKLHVNLEPHFRFQVIRRAKYCRTFETKLMLYITIRILAGASYLDVGWPYELAECSLYKLFDETLQPMNTVLCNLKFPSKTQECLNEAIKFQKLPKITINDLIGALDGVSIAINQAALNETPDPLQPKRLLLHFCPSSCICRLQVSFCFCETRRCYPRFHALSGYIAEHTFQIHFIPALRLCFHR